MNKKLLRALSLTALGFALVACGNTTPSSETSSSQSSSTTITADKSTNANSKSKKELGDDYAMKESSGVGKEWFEQAAVFEQFTVGKTVNEILSFSYGTPGNSSEVLDSNNAGCTISVENFTGALGNLTHEKTLTTSEAPVAGAGISFYGEEENAYNKGTYVFTFKVGGAAVAQDDSTILRSAINSYQVPLKVIEGAVQLNTEMTQAKQTNIDDCCPENSLTKVVSKKELGSLYGMESSANKGEWHEQAEAYETYSEGKLASNLASNKEDVPTDVACSINVDGFASVLKEAAGTNKSTLAPTAAPDTEYKFYFGSYVTQYVSYGRPLVEVSVVSLVTDSQDKVVSSYFDVLQQYVKIA